MDPSQCKMLLEAYYVQSISPACFSSLYSLIEGLCHDQSLPILHKVITSSTQTIHYEFSSAVSLTMPTTRRKLCRVSVEILPPNWMWPSRFSSFHSPMNWYLRTPWSCAKGLETAILQWVGSSLDWRWGDGLDCPEQSPNKTRICYPGQKLMHHLGLLGVKFSIVLSILMCICLQQEHSLNQTSMVNAVCLN